MGRLRDPSDGLGDPIRENRSGGRKRPIRFYRPHSPWQLLVENARLSRQPRATYRMLGDALGVNTSTVWAWLHSEHGVPRRGWTPTKHIPALAELLSLKEDEIMDAYDASVSVFNEQVSPPSPVQIQPLRDLIEVLKGMRSERVNRETILRIAENLLAGATVRREREDQQQKAAEGDEEGEEAEAEEQSPEPPADEDDRASKPDNGNHKPKR